jgi:wobble nucleotide-excising tRNase
MAVARIKQIKRIGSYRVFQNWSPAGTVPGFQRANVIYGTNGSGKSTLGSLLLDCVEGVAPSTLGLQLEVVENGRTSIITEAPDEFWTRVHVFNRDYVNSNLRFDDATGPSSDSLLTLGDINVANEAELAEKQERREKAKEELRDAKDGHRTTQNQVENRLSAVASTIVTELQLSGVQRYRATNVYNKANVRTRLAGDRGELADASTDISADIARANASPMQPVVLGTAPDLSGKDALQSARALLATEVAVKVIEELRGHGDRSAWVQEGISLHVELDHCLFCGEPLTDARRHALTAHFDDALQRMQADIDELVDALEGSARAIQHYASQIPEARDFYSDLVESLNQARDSLRIECETYMSDAQAIVNQLKAKRSNPFQLPDIDPSVKLTAPSISELKDVVDAQRTRYDAHNAEVDQAATRVELARITEFSSEYDAMIAEIASKATVIEGLEGEIDNLDSRITTLKDVTADPVPKAEELTTNVARLLGRSELRFKTVTDGLHYSIERDGLPATHLSEGERTAIALLHFLASVHKDVLSGDEPILIIDDPVSSLDHEILFGASAFLWAGLMRDSHIGQFFLLTHNFELFRQWISQLERAPRAETPDGYTIFELRMRYETVSNASPKRVPRLEAWNSKLSNQLKSQYHFWFSRVAQTLIDASPDLGLAERMELLALAPNAARRMMEGFLSFRYPEHIGSFHKSMGAVLEKVDDEALRNQVERYLHAYSHNEEGDISAMLDPSEATVVFRSLFSLMKAIDSDHVSGMCTALKIDETLLLTVPAGSATVAPST